HFIGTSLVIGCLAAGALVSPWWLLAAPFAGYGFAWVGHFFFERNSPATFRHPLYSLRGDFVMLRDVVTGRLRW
ncbi:MAG: Mpo1-like protein, partial [Steroidobacteraceae bacterium]